jgi:hypothetical protein
MVQLYRVSCIGEGFKLRKQIWKNWLKGGCSKKIEQMLKNSLKRALNEKTEFSEVQFVFSRMTNFQKPDKLCFF